MATFSRVAFVFACAATAATTINVRKWDVNGNELCENQETRCCKWNSKSDRNANFNPAPMVLFSGGCAGSSALLLMVRDLADMSDNKVLDCGSGYELVADIQSGFYGEGHKNVSATVGAFVKRAAEANRTLLFKAEDRFLEDSKTMDMLKEANARFAVLKRWNKLDTALCGVHDCFDQGFLPAPFGYKLDENGKKENSCTFRGRGLNETTTQNKVFVDTDHLLENLRHLELHENDNNADFLAKNNVSFQKLSYDDMFAFYSDTADDLVKSSAAWLGFMELFGVKTNYDTVYSYLKQSRDIFELQRKHSETIANFETVKNVLNNCDKPDCEVMRRMLRE